jgi:hypothetical protein
MGVPLIDFSGEIITAAAYQNMGDEPILISTYEPDGLDVFFPDRLGSTTGLKVHHLASEDPEKPSNLVI